MRRFVLPILSITLLVFAWSCTNEHTVKVKGQLKEGEGKVLYLRALQSTNEQAIDSVKLSENGDFQFKLAITQPAFYQLALKDNKFINLLLEPGQKVVLRGSAANLQNYHLEGSEGSERIQDLESQFRYTQKQMQQLTKAYEDAGKSEDVKAQQAIQEKYKNLMEVQRDSTIHFVMRNMHSLASIMALYQKYQDGSFVLYKNRDLQYLKLVSDTLSKYYPNSGHVKALVADKDRLIKSYYNLQAQSKLQQLLKSKDVKVSNFPEIRLPDQKGDTLSLSNMKSDYVLLNFWAAWNKNSVKQNLALKPLYEKYHRNGFEIFQVSLDSNKEVWKKAINFDELSWIHVIDQQGRASVNAKNYGVQKLPTSFLFYKGEIIMRDPSIADLQQKLSAVFD